jgi:hypothetical protein
VWLRQSSNPDGSVFVCQDVRNSPSFQRSIDHGPHVIELHSSEVLGAILMSRSSMRKTRIGSCGTSSEPTKTT